MTTPVLPTKAQLLAYTLTPTLLIRDAEVETFLIQTDKCAFLQRLFSAWRSGASDVTYTASEEIITQLYEYLTNPTYGYSYLVPNGIEPALGGKSKIVVSGWTV